jgi:hypothetical protein
MQQNNLFILCICLLIFFSSCAQKKGQKVSFVDKKYQKRVDVLIDGELFTAYQWLDDVMKPVLYPIITSQGTEVTRGYPVNPREEHTDHPHHVGLWFNYGNVNGCDFWGYSTASPEEKVLDYGMIIHKGIEKLSGGEGEGILVALAEWTSNKGVKLFDEKTEIHFIPNGKTRIIDHITTLTANEDILMKDTKEGAFAIRVARELELPSDKAITLTDASGNPTDVPVMNNSTASGNYLSSEGIEGEETWGTKARWMKLYGNFGDEKVDVIICDHPKNPGYPTYWHTRGYGLFSANTFGAHDFTNGKIDFNLTVKSGEKVTFRYRAIVNSGTQTMQEKRINSLADDFAKKY